MSIKDLMDKRIEYVLAISRELFVLFDGWRPDPGVVESVYNDFMKSKI